MKADAIAAERNFGGDMVEHVIRIAAQKQGVEVNVQPVTASRGKHIRAQPISALYEQKRAHHVGMFADLEDEMTQWVPGMKSPNRLDALVWAATKVMLDSGNDEWEMH
jgi:phage terminase large subunit-like protein